VSGIGRSVQQFLGEVHEIVGQDEEPAHVEGGLDYGDFGNAGGRDQIK